MDDRLPFEPSDEEMENLDRALGRLTISFPIEVRVEGATRFVLGLGSLAGPDRVVCDASRRIPTFETAAAALAWGKRALCRPGDEWEARFADVLSQALLERQYRQFFRFDLDWWLAWTRQPRTDEITPTSLVGVWNFVALSGELTPAPRGDPATIHDPLGKHGRGVHNLTDGERVAHAMSKAGMLAARAASPPRKSAPPAMPAPPAAPAAPAMPSWPEELWDDGETKRVARALARALTALVARLTDDVAAVERDLTEPR